MTAPAVLALVMGALSLVLSGLAFHWSRQARRLQRERVSRR